MNCEKCGTQIDGENNLCNKCSSPIDSVLTEKQFDFEDKILLKRHKKCKTIIACILIVSVIVGLLIAGIMWKCKETKLQENSISTGEVSIIAGIRGSSVGNINNFGFYAQQGDWIYYSKYLTTDNNYHLYKIRKDGTEKTKLCDDNCQYINVVGDWLYYKNSEYGYTSYDSLIKIKTDGKNRTILDEGANYDYMNVVGDWIYYSSLGKDNKIYKIRTDGKKKSIVSNDVALLINAVDGWIYYLGENNNIYKIRSNGTEKTKINNDESQDINVVGKWIYYCNQSDNHSIYKIRTDGKQRTKLNNESSFFLNVEGDWIYYSKYIQKSSTVIITGGPIYRIRINGKERTKLNNDDCTDIFLIDDWIYYTKNMNETNNLQFKMRTDGTQRQEFIG